MEIAVVRKEYSLARGGAERYCVNLTRQLLKLGHRVTVVGESIDDALTSEVRFVSVRVNNATSWTKNRSFADNAARVINSGRYELVLGLSRTLGTDVFRITDRLQAHWLGIRYPNRILRGLQHLNPRHRTLLGLERQILGSSSVRRVITESKLDARLIEHYYRVPAERIRTVYNGVDIHTFHPGVRLHRAAIREQFKIGLNDPLLMFASMDFRGKGLHTVLKAMASVPEIPVRLLVLGRGRRGAFERVTKHLGLGDRVTFAGWQRGIERFYGAGDLFVLPTAYEPFGLVHLEALACGLPVLTTATAGGAEVIDHGGNGYVISHSQAAGELADCLRNYFGLSEDDREKMRSRAWQKASGMTLEHHAQQTLAVLEEAWRDKFRV